MGQKINPIGFRMGTYKTWQSKWFVDDKRYKQFLFEDIKIRESLMARFKLAGITKVEIERLPKSMVVVVTVARPGIVIGRGGSGLEELKKLIVSIIRESRKENARDLKIELKVNEVKNPDLSAHLVANRIVMELERRMPHRRVLTRIMDRVMAAGGLGIKVVLTGRIAGSEIGRTEKFKLGSIPAQTLRENIDYAEVPALLKRGYVGIKVYIHKKEEEEE